ncbi:CocE/NonD family hydrolase [Streptomyces sp. NPDC047315]|uniref:CocE/NonD family hydrolase n=1 Tax=Streptomyces sp. NPDC047315 TaxID=3155142 RepID=UPI0033CA6B5E
MSHARPPAPSVPSATPPTPPPLPPPGAPVRHDDVRIPLHDGTLLHARVWRPPADDPAPVLLEYAPDRLTDATAARDSQRHPWYAAHGYASVRVDARGHGNSTGSPAPAADPTATAADAAEVVDWLAAQPWSTGRIGAFGLGAGADVALRLAALAPGPLAAVVAVGATDAPYDNGGAYLGGSVAADSLHSGATALLAEACRPPDPAYAGGAWRELWAARLETVTPPLHALLSHQLRDDFWDDRAVGGGAGLASVRVPVLAVGGWRDPYRDTVLRLLAALPANRVRGLVGPWSHQYPDRGRPGPAIGFLHETLRWWEPHLRGVDGPSAEEPLLRVWLATPGAPGAHNDPDGPGHWIAEDAWPSPRVRTVPYPLTGPPRLVATPQHTGVDAGRWLSTTGRTSDRAPDQRSEDARSACFEFPVEGDAEEEGEDVAGSGAGGGVAVLGNPRVTLRLRMDVPHGQVVVRLCDVAPDGSSALVTRGVLNLAARHGRERAHAWTPGETEDVALELHSIGYVFPPGHRIRLAVSSAYWPWVWPQTGSTGFVLVPGGSRLDLPVRSGANRPADRPPRAEPERSEPLGISSAAPLAAPGEEPVERRVIRDVDTGEWRVETDPRPRDAQRERRYPDGLELFEDAVEIRTIQEDDPLSARAETKWTVRFHRPEDPRDSVSDADGAPQQPGTGTGTWTATVEVRSSLACDAADFVAEDEVICRAGREAVFHRTWKKRFPRIAG